MEKIRCVSVKDRKRASLHDIALEDILQEDILCEDEEENIGDFEDGLAHIPEEEEEEDAVAVKDKNDKIELPVKLELPWVSSEVYYDEGEQEHEDYHDNDSPLSPCLSSPLSRQRQRKSTRKRKSPAAESDYGNTQSPNRKRNRRSSPGGKVYPTVFSASQPIPRRFQVKVVLEDIAKSKSSVSRRITAATKIKKKVTPKPKRRRKVGRPRKKIEKPSSKKRRRRGRRKTTARLTQKEKQLLEKKYNRLRRWRKRAKWSLLAICRRRLRYQRQLNESSEQTQLTLEKILLRPCKLHTLHNRKKFKSQQDDNALRENNSSLIHLKCDYCDKRFLGQRRKTKHMKAVHMEDRKQRQNLMKKRIRDKFVKTGEGPKWLKRERFVKKALVCEVCGQRFTYPSSLYTHMRRLHSADKQDPICPLCPERSFCKGYYLWHHFASTHMNYNFDIIKWSKEKGRKLGLNYKQNSKNTDPFGPMLKMKAARGPNKTEIKTDAENQEHICDVCGAIYETQLNLKRHYMSKHTDLQWTCATCSKTFKSKDARDAHVRQIHEGLDYRCDICNRKMQSKGKLWTHKVEHHGMKDLEPPEDLTIFQCHFCGLKMLRGLEKHVKALHPEKFSEFQVIRKKELKLTKKRYLDRHRHGSSVKPWKNVRKDQKKVKCILVHREMMLKWENDKDSENDMSPPKCHMCGLSVSEIEGSWEDHLQNAIGSRKDIDLLVCPMEGCLMAYLSVFELKIHAHEHTKLGFRQEIACSECDKVGMHSLDEAVVHFIVKHPEIYSKYKGALDPCITEEVLHSNPDQQPLEAEYRCPFCGNYYFHDADMRNHAEVTHPNECWYCPEPTCTKVILSPEEMEEHFLSAHGDDDDPRPAQVDNSVIEEKSNLMTKSGRKSNTPKKRPLQRSKVAKKDNRRTTANGGKKGGARRKSKARSEDDEDYEDSGEEEECFKASCESSIVQDVQPSRRSVRRANTNRRVYKEVGSEDEEDSES